jgi:hypothetical protein
LEFTLERTSWVRDSVAHSKWQNSGYAFAAINHLEKILTRREQAAEDALHRLYLTKTPSELLSLPTDTFAEGHGSVYDLSSCADVEYVPGEIGEAEVAYGSKDR